MVKLFMDESGNENTLQPLIVGAVELGDDADDVEKRIQDASVEIPEATEGQDHDLDERGIGDEGEAA